MLSSFLFLHTHTLDEFGEDLLSAHESELDRMRGIYQDNKDIFDLLQKRDKFWEQQIELDVRQILYIVMHLMSQSSLLLILIDSFTILIQRQATDPNRFNNRGGQLQKQLKLKKQLEKELPRTEKELRTVIGQWEEDHERHFVIHDTRFLDLMEQQIEDRCSKKEMEKMKKVRMTWHAYQYVHTFNTMLVCNTCILL